MMYPQPAPRRRLWPVVVPLVLVLALAVIWTGLWFYAASAAEATMADWRASAASRGAS